MKNHAEVQHDCLQKITREYSADGGLGDSFFTYTKLVPFWEWDTVELQHLFGEFYKYNRVTFNLPNVVSTIQCKSHIWFMSTSQTE